ncbi:MAG: PDZ domain-containing protein [Nitrososphaeraceae archaeon]|nr:PDZ domain-containing protein [Nitrososphaeraceae archaeon]
MNLLPSLPFFTSSTIASPSATAPSQSPQSESHPAPLSSSTTQPSSLLNPSIVQAQQQEVNPDEGNNVSTTGSLASTSPKISLPEIFKKTENSVVQITSTRPGSDQIVTLNGREIPQNNIALGSGFVYDQDGRIITNHHVVSEVDEVDVKFVDGDTYTAKVVGKDPYSDIGVLQITDREFFDKRVAPLKIANSSEIEVGEQIIAIGNPFGLSGTLTTGVVSQIGRLLPNDVTGYSIANTIQTDAAINPGNSGGPLLDMKGEVVGMNTAIFSNTGVYSGVGFAVPSNMLLKEIPVLIEKGSYVHPWLGFTARDVSPDIAESLKLPRNFKGAAVVSVVENSPADKADIRGQATGVDFVGNEQVRSGDIVTKIDSQPVKSMDDVISYLDESKKVGDKVTLTVNREGQDAEVPITLEERPSSSPRLLAASSSQQQQQQEEREEEESDPNPPLFRFPEIPGFPELPKLFP